VPVPIKANCRVEGIKFAEYAAGATPDSGHFQVLEESMGIQMEGQELKWIELVLVNYKDENNQKYYKRYYVMPNSLLDPAEAPAPTKTGYSLAGWRRYGEQKLWDFETDLIVRERTNPVLLEVWKLEAPAVSVTDRSARANGNENVTMTAEVSHVLSGLTCTYAWYKDGALLEGKTANTLTVGEPGVYTVKVTASDGKLTSEKEINFPIDSMEVFPNMVDTPVLDTPVVDTPPVIVEPEDQEPGDEGDVEEATGGEIIDGEPEDETEIDEGPVDEVEEAPKTGDGSHTGLQMALLGIAAAAVLKMKKRGSVMK